MVSISKCESYDSKLVQAALFGCLDRIQGFREKIRGKRILIKTNLLMKKRPEEAVTTHPAVIEALVIYLQKLNCSVIIGDSPGGPFTYKSLYGIYKTSGMEDVAKNTGCELNFDTSSVHVENYKAKMLKSMDVIKVLSEVDYVISAAKLKTHGMMTYTGAVKNLFGVIPGLTKADYHFKMNDATNFAEHLIDICEYVSPIISIIDGVEGMEGDGPSAGDKRHVGLLLASINPYELDLIAANNIGLKSDMVPTIYNAIKRGLSPKSIDNVTVEGISLHDINIVPFRLPKSLHVNFVRGFVPKFLENIILSSLRPVPVFNYEKCITCKDCQRSCPADVITFVNNKPVVNLDKCIRCFCCHELCPKKAVDIKKHWLYERIFK